MFGSLDISTSGLIAQRTRMNVISANIANMHTTRGPDGQIAPFQRRMALFAPGNPAGGSNLGVHVQQIELDTAPFKKVHEPGHPDADPDGYVHYPNIDPAIEMMNMLEASRAYEANITAAEATKSMMNTTLRLLA
jgi:flagellar basal-body rod protein FlgC